MGLFKKIAEGVKNTIEQLHENHQENVQQRKDSRAERLEIRNSGRSERRGIKQDGRTERANGRQETRQVAYANGIDPHAAWANMGSSIANSAGSALSSIYGGGMKPGMLGNMSEEQLAAMNSKPAVDSKMILLFIGVLVFFGLMKGGEK